MSRKMAELQNLMSNVNREVQGLTGGVSLIGIGNVTPQRIQIVAATHTTPAQYTTHYFYKGVDYGIYINGAKSARATEIGKNITTLTNRIRQITSTTVSINQIILDCQASIRDLQSDEHTLSNSMRSIESLKSMKSNAFAKYRVAQSNIGPSFGTSSGKGPSVHWGNVDVAFNKSSNFGSLQNQLKKLIETGQKLVKVGKSNREILERKRAELQRKLSEQRSLL